MNDCYSFRELIEGWSRKERRQMQDQVEREYNDPISSRTVAISDLDDDRVRLKVPSIEVVVERYAYDFVATFGLTRSYHSDESERDAIDGLKSEIVNNFVSESLQSCKRLIGLFECGFNLFRNHGYFCKNKQHG